MVGDQVSLWVTIPTAGDRADLLETLVRQCGVKPSNIVIVRTRPCRTPLGVHVLDDYGPVNIHRWWNAGIDFAQQQGATHVAVLNDDLVLDPSAIAELVRAQDITGATIASPGAVWQHVTDGPAHTRDRRIVGWCFVLDLSSGVRPNEDYSWWFGDDELDFDARIDGSGVVLVPVNVKHPLANLHTEQSPQLQELAAADERLFRERWEE